MSFRNDILRGCGEYVYTKTMYEIIIAIRTNVAISMCTH